MEVLKVHAKPNSYTFESCLDVCFGSDYSDLKNQNHIMRQSGA